jgi:hypothetical protein
MAHIPPTLTRSTAATNIKLRDESLQHAIPEAESVDQGAIDDESISKETTNEESMQQQT